MNGPLFPGATQFSRVGLYGDLNTTCVGGTPHVHTACTEAYIGLRGAGHVEVLSTGGHDELPLHQGDVVWFSPGVIHRGVPTTDPTEVLVLMQNAGLPEAGDAVLTLPERCWDEVDNYRTIVDISAPTADEQRELVARRRELALEGLEELAAKFRQNGPPALDGFYAFARAVVAPRLAEMRKLVGVTAEREVTATNDALSAMEDGSIEHLRNAQVARQTQPEPAFGMCGVLHAYRGGA